MRLLILSDLHLEFRAPQPHHVCWHCGKRYGKQDWYPGVFDAWGGSMPGRCGVCNAEGVQVASPVECGDLDNTWNLRLPHPDQYDVAILAGDIHNGRKVLPAVAKLFPPDKDVALLLGNHEFYGEHINKLTLDLHEAVKQFPNIHLLDDSCWHFGNVRFIGSTLWTDFRLMGSTLADIAHSMRVSKDYITDFRTIRFGSTGYMTPGDSVKLHMVSRNFLADQLREPYAGKTVVITHHLPSKKSVSEIYKNDITSAAFASHLDDLVEQADVWIHGHTHDSFDYEVAPIHPSGTFPPRGKGGKCRVVCNPRGYPTNRITDEYENPDFDPQLIIEI